MTERKNKHLSEKQLDYQRKVLLKKRRQILAPPQFGQVTDNSDSLPEPYKLQLVREIDAAIHRIERGTYGLCQTEGKPIDLQLLQTIPWTRYCRQHIPNSYEQT